MRVRSIRIGTTMVAAYLTASIAGCGGSPPSAGVSDFGVFTTLHLQAVQQSAVPGKPVAMPANLARYFASTPAEYARDKTRMDVMLDGMQRGSGYAQAIKTALSASADIDTRSGDVAGDAPGDGGDGAGSDSPKIPDEILEKIDAQLTTQVVDSPFDQLDRVSDFFAAYILKFVRLSGDSRTVDPDLLAEAVHVAMSDPDGGAYLRLPAIAEMAQMAKDAEDEEDAEEPPDRLIMLYIQVHVDPGTGANNMVGVRLKITDAEGARPDEVHVVRLHPTRNYDLDSVMFAEDLSQSLSLALNVDAKSPATSAQAAARREASLQAAERRRFLSRVGKTGSFASASERTFGWDFYPSNLEVVKPNALEAIGGWLFGTPRAYNVRGTLEAGGRDCSVILVIPHGLESFTCEASYEYAALNPDGVPGARKSVPIPGSMTVDIPRYHPLETWINSLAPASSMMLLPSGDERFGPKSNDNHDDHGRERVEIPPR